MNAFFLLFPYETQEILASVGPFLEKLGFSAI